MRKLLLLVALSLVASLAPGPLHAQQDRVTVQVAPGETCPVGWTTTNTAWTKAERIYYVLPPELADDYRRTHIRGTPEFRVSQAFVTRVWPTLTQQQAAYAAGSLRSEPATSGTSRTCTIGQ